MLDRNDQAPADPLPPELAALQGVAAAADARAAAANDPPPTGEPGAPGAPGATVPIGDRGLELSAMLQMAVTVLEPVLPFLPSCYPPEVCDRIGTATAAVAQKRGWNLDLVASPELALACVAIPPTVQAVVMGRSYFAWRAAQDARAARPKPTPAPPPPATSTTTIDQADC